jgi:uncharacterized protein (DUF1330 family)
MTLPFGEARQRGGKRLESGIIDFRPHATQVAGASTLIYELVAQAIAAHDSPGYQEALRALGNGADRDLRIVEGIR